MREPKFRQIAHTIEERIKNGEYPSNSKLPTHRMLAKEFKTTPVTIAKAYQQLSDRNLVESHIGKGTFVCGISHLHDAIKPSESQNEFNFSILQPCLKKNVNQIKQAMTEVSHHLNSNLIGYTDDSGHEFHRQAGVTWAKHYGLEGGTITNTLLVDGAQHALSLLISTLTKPGDTIAAEALTYPGIIALANLTERHIIGVDSDEQGMCPSNLQSVINQHNPKLVIIIPSHQNPTGITMPESRRREIAKIIKNNHILLVEDNIYCFLDEKIIPPISNFIPQLAFYISSLSKAISPAMRCGYLKVPDNFFPKINSHIRTSIWLASPFNFAIATELIMSGEAFNIVQTQRKTALIRQDIANKILSDLTYSSSGYHLWLQLPDSWTPERFVMEAKNKNIIVSSGNYFDVSKTGTNSIRLSLMSIEDENILARGLKIIRDLINSNMDTIFPF